MSRLNLSHCAHVSRFVVCATLITLVLSAGTAQAQVDNGTMVQIRSGSLCMTTTGAQGGSVTVSACDAESDDPTQLFFVQEQADNIYHFLNSGGLYLDVSGAGTTSGTDVILWSGTGGTNQRHRVEAVGGGFRLHPQHADGLCMENSSSNVVVSTCSAAAGQVWTFQQVGSVGTGRDCNPNELYVPYFAENTQGGPTGANVVILTNGYMMVLFAPDSGNPPGVLHFYDVENPRTPQLEHRIDNSDTQQFREAHSLPVAFYGDKEYVAIQTIAGIQFWDLTDPLSASLASKIDLPGVEGGDYDNVAWQADWQGRYLFVSGSNQGVYVIDTIDITKPELLNQVPNGTTGGFRVGPLFARGPYLVLGNMDQNGALAVLDAFVPDAPTLLSTRNDLPRTYTFTATGDRIYGAGRDGDFTIHGFSNPTSIEEVSITTITQDSLYVATQDHFVYSGRQDNFVKIDVSNEASPQIVGEGTLSRDHPDHGQVTPVGNWLFIGNDHGTGSAFFCHAETDDLPPVADWVYPPDGATNLDPKTRITVGFSDYLETRDLRTGGFSVRKLGGETVDGIISYNFNTVGFTPLTDFEDNTAYEIVLSGTGLHDAMGNPVGVDTIYRFDVGEPVDGPGTGGSSTGVGGSSNPGAGGVGGASAGGTMVGGAAGNGTMAGGNASIPGAGGATDRDSEAVNGCACRSMGNSGHSGHQGALLLLTGLLALWGLRRNQKASGH